MVGVIMGELIRKVAEIQLGNETLMIELNESTSNTGYKDIHIQNEKFRLCLPQDEFMQMAACILLAQKQLKLIKENKE